MHDFEELVLESSLVAVLQSVHDYEEVGMSARPAVKID
jgi:hypothetical protein